MRSLLGALHCIPAQHSFIVVMQLQVKDIAVEDYIACKPKFAVFVPHTAGRYQKKRFRKAQCPIVERSASHRGGYNCIIWAGSLPMPAV